MHQILALAASLILTSKAELPEPKIKTRPIAEVGLFVFDQEKKWQEFFEQHPEIIIDHVSSKGLEIYGPRGIEKWAKNLGAKFIVIQDEKILKKNNDISAGYPSYETWTQELKKLAQENPDILSLFSIGKSVQGRDLWVAKISDNVMSDEFEPEVKYIANMHGDEIVGREVVLRFIKDLVAQYKKGNARISKLINNSEIFLMPSMNPDGAQAQRRSNANFIDLNRDFPDFSTTDSRNTPDGRAPETQAVMRFQDSRHFSLSANFHGGAVVVNYPWDTIPESHPLEGMIVDFSTLYASQVPEMRDSTEFKNGIVNGYAWYEVDGGMQDWSYFWYNDLQVTIELSQIKWPNYNTVNQYYEDNKNAMVNYLEFVAQGAGFKLPSLDSGSVTIADLQNSLVSFGPYNFKNGEFYKVLPPGHYQFNITTARGESTVMQFEVKPHTKL